MTKAKKIAKSDAGSQYLADMLAAFDARAAYEASKNAENSNIQKTLAAQKASVNHSAIAEVFHAANLSADFINRSERSNARFNVYSAEKVINIARTVKHVDSLNHYTRAILSTLAAFKSAALVLTHSDAVSCCSSDSHVSKGKQAHIVRYAKVTSASTASTQASSSLNALLQMHIISEGKNSANETVFSLNNNEIAQALIKTLAE